MAPSDEHHDDPPVPGLPELYANRRAPEHLEDRVVDAVRADGWGAREEPRHAPGNEGRRPPGLLQLVAGIVLFAAGFAAGMASRTPAEGASAPTPSATQAATHMLVLWEGPDFAPSLPSEEIAAQYGAWRDGVARGGSHVSGNELAPPDRRRIHTPGDREGRGTDAPPLDARIGGYFIVEVPDDATAARLASGHPHLGHGGWVEVAPIVRR